MSNILQFIRRLITPKSVDPLPSPVSRRIDLSRFAGTPKLRLPLAFPNLPAEEGDRVLLDGQSLSRPLRLDQKNELPQGSISHNEIIGKPVARTVVKTNSGWPYQIAYPTLDEYVALSPRKVTPVYASYASLIVSLLDIHVTPPLQGSGPPRAPPLEILESGTGHGSLTLHLARAISAANGLPAQPTSSDDPDTTRWRAQRSAILHSVEILPDISTHAQKVVKTFRQGMYFPHVDFHVASVTKWVEQQVAARHGTDEGFLSYVVLDMPDVHTQLAAVVRAMKIDALIAVFVPSVTQIGDCVKAIAKEKLPLEVEKTVEMGEGISNGRVWDVRITQKRKSSGNARRGHLKEILSANTRMRPDQETQGVDTYLTKGDITEGDSADGDAAEQESDAGARHGEDSVMVCRPKVGMMTLGGGFVGMWRKIDPNTIQSIRSKPKGRGGRWR